MDNFDLFEQKEKVLLEQLECWKQIREKLRDRIVHGDLDGKETLRFVRALEIIADEEMQVLGELYTTPEEERLE